MPLKLGGLSGQLRLEPVLGIQVAYRDPGAAAPQAHEIRGRAVSVVRR